MVALESGGNEDEDMKLSWKHRDEFSLPSHPHNKVKHCSLGSAFDSKFKRLEIRSAEALTPVVDVLSVLLGEAG